MDLRCVTVTGADDSVSPQSLLDLSREFPFVEWGILASRSNEAGSSRFPAPRWFTDLQGLAETTGELNLSLHLCGRWVRDLLLGDVTFPESRLHCFGRVQLNFHAERTPCIPAAFNEVLKRLGKQWIFQIDGADGNAHLQSVYGEPEPANNCYGLFDLSGGAGIVPDVWPEPYFMSTDTDYTYCGYAGGLGPQNLAWELKRIGDASKGAPIWIDMETHVRSRDDRVFDLYKVRECLKIAAPFIHAPIPH